jgi:hypothetical protein
VLELVDSLRTPASQPCPEVPACANCPFCPKPVPRFGHAPQLDAAFLFSGLITAAITSRPFSRAKLGTTSPVQQLGSSFPVTTGAQAATPITPDGSAVVAVYDDAAAPSGRSASTPGNSTPAPSPHASSPTKSGRASSQAAITEARARPAESNGRSRYIPRAQGIELAARREGRDLRPVCVVERGVCTRSRAGSKRLEIVASHGVSRRFGRFRRDPNERLCSRPDFRVRPDNTMCGFAGNFTGATGLEPATSGVTGRFEYPDD